MVQALEQGLLITLIGMGLVFIMIILLWGIMALLVSVTNKREAEAAEGPEEVVLTETSGSADKEKLAAAIAIACALQADKAFEMAAPSSVSTGASQWLSSGRTQQILNTTHKGRKA